MSSAVPPAAAPGTAARPGYDPDDATAARRVLPMLADERVAWVSTVTADGRPHLVPTWFWWDGEALLVWSKPNAVKVRNLRANPRLMVAVGDAAGDFAVGLIEADATLVDVPVPDAFLAKYGRELAAGELDPASFRALYTQAVRITPTRFLRWHGRGAQDRAAAPDRTAVPYGAAAPRAPRPSRAAAAGAWVADRLDALASRLRPASPRAAAA